MLSPQLLELLRAWWREGRRRSLLLPGGWLFPGRNPVEPLSARQLCHAVRAAAQAAGIKKRVSPEHSVPGVVTISLWHLRTPARHYGPVPDQAIEHRSTDHPAVITGAQLSLISAKPSTATAAQTSNPHSRPGAHPPSRGFLLRRLSDAGPPFGCTLQ